MTLLAMVCQRVCEVDSDIRRELLQAARTGDTMSKLPGSSDSQDSGERSVTENHRDVCCGLGVRKGKTNLGWL